LECQLATKKKGADNFQRMKEMFLTPTDLGMLEAFMRLLVELFW